MNLKSKLELSYDGCFDLDLKEKHVQNRHLSFGGSSWILDFNNKKMDF